MLRRVKTADRHDSSPDACDRCERPKNICVCDRIEAAAKTRVAVRILQHPQEQDIELGSARLLEQLLKDARVIVGLSWGSLTHALGEEAKPREWAVIYPSQLPRALSPKELAASFVVFDRDGKQLLPAKLKGILVLDGTWSQAKALWWRNPWLLRLSRIVLHPREPSIYGKLRKEPRNEYLSTLESVADALVGLGEPAELREEMRKTFRTMVQRARDVRRGTEAKVAAAAKKESAAKKKAARRVSAPALPAAPEGADTAAAPAAAAVASGGGAAPSDARPRRPWRKRS